MMERLAQEPEIIQEYLTSMNENGRKGIKVETLGLIVNVNHVFFLAASPDGMINDPPYNPSEAMLKPMLRLLKNNCQLQIFFQISGTYEISGGR